ncbi:MAG TPA: FtsQ-type POTRA domain-containing protein [Opitutaceae bacterium]|nr:FtsQ-type POTRA domain-containing protein [Opitutaceae bacterium]
MNRPAPNLVAARSWRDIPQDIAPRSMSREGRRRMSMGFAKWVGAVVMIGVGVWGAVEVWNAWQEDPTKLTAPVKSEPLRTIRLSTDGVLDLAWIERKLELPKGVTLMELDLPRLQRALLADAQVRTAVLTRKFPDTLVASIQERTPVGRLRVADAYGISEDFLVSRDGMVFPGANFATELLDTLPWLDGVRLQRSGASFIPISGMETVTDLFSTAQAYVPLLYRNWRIVSLERLQKDGEIVVKTADKVEIVFGTRDDFFKQVALLDSVLAELKTQPARAVASINLTFGNRQVPVSFVPETPPSTTPVRGTVSPIRTQPSRPASGRARPQTAADNARRSLIHFQPSQTIRNTPRDL